MTKILVADDDLMSLRLLRRTLEREQYEVETVTHGGMAVERLIEPDGPRLALLDWMMPVMDGPGVCREVRRRRTNQHVHLLMLTSKSSKEDVVEGLNAGADDYLTKPFDAAELKARLRTGLRILELEDRLIQAREEMRFKATHDPLTGLLNRGAILEHMARELARTAREGSSTTVLLADVDHFKAVNDRYGHPAGDDVLREMGHILLNSCRPYDYVGRYGGEEFLLVMTNCDVAVSLARAEEIRRSVEAAAFDTVGGSLRLTASVGVFTSATFPPLGPDDVLRETDLALYRAKHDGRNCIRLAEPTEAEVETEPLCQLA
jgi:diguanylate cyclase (GGDEF)-like protein